MKQDPKRIATWWILWNDLKWPNPDTADLIRRRAEKLARANATSVMVFGTHFRWDFLPYFTLLNDYLATVAEELHGYGIEFYDHHSVNLVHRYDTREEWRNVMLHSGPHLPFSPCREAAADWTYKGKKLNDWRMIDVVSGKPLYYPQYTAEGFCYNNPDFVASYADYAKNLVRETGIDGLAADDAVHYMRFNSCACPHCRAALKQRTGRDLPPADDMDFWGNWDNPDWLAWIDLRYEGVSRFFSDLSAALPENFEIMTCGRDSASAVTPARASDARVFSSGCTRVNLSMGGNTPPYSKDPKTRNTPVFERYVASSLHKAVARAKDSRCLGTAFAFREETADLAWALNKAVGSDLWLVTLKQRLGLPDHILETLPEEGDIVGRAFTYEKEHPELFAGQEIGRAAVYYSYETRDHTLFGSQTNGYYADYQKTLTRLLNERKNVLTVDGIPQDPGEFPLLIVPSAARMKDEERDALRRYLAAGGTAIVTGPSPLPECEHHWEPANRVSCAPDDFFCRVENGGRIITPEWQKPSPVPPRDENRFREVLPGLYYDPCRSSDPAVMDGVLELFERFAPKPPVEVLSADGYYTTVFRSENVLTVHALAADYDVEIDEELDRMRFHRSRVNLITKIRPKGITGLIRVRAEKKPAVFLPFSDREAEIEKEGDHFTVKVPLDCYYAILSFPN